jgi:hypothetical protein
MITPKQYNLDVKPISRGMSWNAELVFHSLSDTVPPVKIPFDNTGLSAVCEFKTNSATVSINQTSGIDYADVFGGKTYTLNLTPEQTLILNQSTIRYSFYFVQGVHKWEYVFGTIPSLDT